MWKITKFSASVVASSGLSHLSERKWLSIVAVAARNLLNQSNTMVRRVFRIMGHSIKMIGLWLMVFCICLALALVAIAIVLLTVMLSGINKLSVATDKVKRTLKG
jgi:hypothetical protein